MTIAMPSAPIAEMDCWRPTEDDVERISWGRPAKKKGTGSRGMPHRLNDEERKLFDFARKKGFVEISGSGWRRQRAGKPLVNTFRSWCDAAAHPAIFIHKGDALDEVMVDLSPLRTPSKFKEAAAFCLSLAPDGIIAMEPDGVSLLEDKAVIAGYKNKPLYQSPMYSVSWQRPRPLAKSFAKDLAERLGTQQKKGRPKSKGLPQVKPGKSRRHGGYGIGGKAGRERQPVEEGALIDPQKEEDDTWNDLYESEWSEYE